MYIPRQFEAQDIDAMHGLMRPKPLATLVTLNGGSIEANPAPLLLSAEPGPYGTLSGHVVCANPLWWDRSADAEVLVVFHGADSYVRPSWNRATKDAMR